MVDVVSAPVAVFGVVRELANQTEEALVDVYLSIQLEARDVQEPLRCSAEVTVVHDVHAHVVIKEGASDAPHVEEDMDLEVPKLKRHVLPTTNEGRGPDAAYKVLVLVIEGAVPS